MLKPPPLLANRLLRALPSLNGYGRTTTEVKTRAVPEGFAVEHRDPGGLLSLHVSFLDTSPFSRPKARVCLD